MKQVPAMTAAEKSRADEVQELYTQAHPAVNEVPDAARLAVQKILAPALRAQPEDAKERAARTGEILHGLTVAVKKSGDSVWHAARGALVGTIEAAVAARWDPLEAMDVATRALVTEQLELEGDFAAAAKGAVQGAIQACEELGLDVQRAARVAARSAFETANAARKAAGVKVKEVLGTRVLGYATGLE